MSEAEKQKQIHTLGMAGGFAIHHSELMGRRFEDLICQTLDFHKDALVYSIVLNANNLPLGSDGEPTFSGYFVPVRAIVINLQKHFDDALVEIAKDDNCLSLQGMIWLELCLSLLHEAKHGIDLAKCEDEAKFSLDESACKDAHDWAYEALMIMASSGQVDLEMPNFDEEPFFASLIHKAQESFIDGEEDWQKFQVELIEEGLCYKHDDFGAPTFMDYLKRLNNGKHTWVERLDAPTEAIEPEVVEEKPLAEAAEDIVVAPTVVAEPVMPATPAPHTIATPVETTLLQEGVEIPVENSEIVEDFANGNDVDIDHGDEIEGGEVPDTAVEPHGLAPEQCQTIMAAVIHRLYCHIFNKCGMTVGSDVGFTNPAGVLEPCYIGDIAGAERLVISYDTSDEMGKFLPHIPTWGADEDGRKSIPDGHIRGLVSKDGRIPGFVFYVNVDGHLQRRAFRAQDCNKMKGDVRAPWAQQAFDGSMLATLMKDLTEEEKAGGVSSIVAKVITQPGQSTVLTFLPFDKNFSREVILG